MTTYTTHPIEPTLLAQLWENLWRRGHVELTRLGYTEQGGYEQFLKYGKQAVDSGIICADGVPVAVAGICPDGDGYFTFFQATEAFCDHVRKITKTMREHVRKHSPVYIYSVLVHPDTERWFGVIGFKRDDWSGLTPVGTALHRFSRR